MEPPTIGRDVFERYESLQRYVGWTSGDAARVARAAEWIRPGFAALVNDFYATIQSEPNAAKVITGGAEQIARLKGTLIRWLEELFAGTYDEAYVARRWNVGWRHVEIGLDQVYTNVALSRLRKGLTTALEEMWPGGQHELQLTIRSLNQLLDLDLAIIEDAYQTEYTLRQQRSERLAAIGKVAGGIAHELRNPLNVVKTSVYYLLHAKNPTPSKTAEHLERIERQCGVADDVITALSDFAKLPLPEFKQVRVEVCLREALANVIFPANVEVVCEFPADMPAALGDFRQLGIVFSNLIRNARDAMLQGGKLTLSGAPAGAMVELRVMDTGLGIKPEDLPRIMEPLFSTKARGIGLGLAISRAIVDKHEGVLTVESEPGRGTTFSIRLPAARPAPERNP